MNVVPQSKTFIGLTLSELKKSAMFFDSPLIASDVSFTISKAVPTGFNIIDANPALAYMSNFSALAYFLNALLDVRQSP